MRCSVCGQLLADEAKYCPSCGSKIEGQPVKVQEHTEYNGQQAFNDDRAEDYHYDTRTDHDWQTDSGENYRTYHYTSNQQPAMPMKWYKFLIYVSLLLSGVSNVFMGVEAVTGMHYGDADTAAQIYSTYSALKIVDVIYGIALIALGLYAFVVRTKLARYRKDAPKQLMLFYAVAFIMNLVYVAGASLAIGANLMTVDLVMSMAVSAVMIIANKVYFDKRAHLFNT